MGDERCIMMLYDQRVDEYRSTIFLFLSCSPPVSLPPSPLTHVLCTIPLLFIQIDSPRPTPWLPPLRNVPLLGFSYNRFLPRRAGWGGYMKVLVVVKE